MSVENPLATRYSRANPGQRVLALVVVGALVLGAAGFLGWSVLFYSRPEVQSRLLTFEVLDANRVVADVVVVRADPDVRASCVAQALAEDHSVVGTASLPVESGPLEQRLRLEIRTEREATAVQWLACTAPGQPRPR